jgi:hypothetical protein
LIGVNALSVEVRLVASPLSINEQVYVTNRVLGPAAAVALARRNGVDLSKYDWWRVSLTPQARRALEARARDWQAQRRAEIAQAYQDNAAPKPSYDGNTWRKSRNGLRVQR